MTSSNTDYIDVYQNIEVGLKYAYEIDPNMTDTLCIFALDNAKIAIKQRFGFAQNEKYSDRADMKTIIDWCVDLGVMRINDQKDLTLKEYLNCLDKIKRSVTRHSAYGARSYYSFIKDFLP